MKIKLDDTHILNSDQYSCWVTRKTRAKDKDGNETGKTYERRVSGYYNNLEQVFTNYLDRHLNESEHTSLKALRKDLKETKESIHEWIERSKTNGN